MSCRELQPAIMAVARGESVSAAEERSLQGHLEACASCARRLANQRKLSEGLAAMAFSAGAPPASLKAELITEFRRRRKVVPVRRPVWPWIMAAAVAAALVIAIFVARSHPSRPETAVVHPAAKVPVAVAPAAVEPSVPPVHRAARKRPPKAKAPAAVKKEAPEETTETATDFIAIPYAEPLPPYERADVYRVQVPRAAMAQFGLPVVGPLDSRVTADVLAGEDGVVRAVRFIH